MNSNLEIFSQAKTITELKLLESELDLLHESLFATASNQFETILATKVRQKTAVILRQILMEKPGNPEEVIDNLKGKLRSFKPFKVALAFEPSGRFIEQICTWVRENIAPQAVLDVVYDPNLIGGAQFFWQGRFCDQSLKKRLDDYFATVFST